MGTEWNCTAAYFAAQVTTVQFTRTGHTAAVLRATGYARDRDLGIGTEIFSGSDVWGSANSGPEQRFHQHRRSDRNRIFDRAEAPFAVDILIAHWNYSQQRSGMGRGLRFSGRTRQLQHLLVQLSFRAFHRRRRQRFSARAG